MCALPKRVLQSLDFTANRVLMKLFNALTQQLSNSAGISSILNCHTYSFRDVLLMITIRFINHHRLFQTQGP